MLSEAGKSYSKTQIVNPYNTRQRFRYYQLAPIKSSKKETKQFMTLNTNLREKHDSFMLRHHKQIVTNTDHSPNYDTILSSSPRQPFSQGHFQRYIGHINNQDYSVPLEDSCDHRCLRASIKKLQKVTSTASSKKEAYEKMCDSELETASVEKNDLSRSEGIQSLDLSMKLKGSQLKSTETSLLKKRSNFTIELDKDISDKPARHKGISFESSIGHQYLNEIDGRKISPDFYNIQQAKQSLIRKSFKEPCVNVSFGSFRNSVATRYDRADPEWHLSIDSSLQQIPENKRAYDFRHYSERKDLQVKSKYPHRASMNLYSFKPKDDCI